ncbi:hypothetical protein GCM10007094_23560 [Pseudovibrio japonicus]|uniref:DRBM domain-containing protein n=1 Tax=Pseudovibrio japonicus TaxID=366534 RepID=A0ABQ3EKW4_9HYPH|nr:hypothetical protein [Pseudovibrio japonicus]GHB33922.1 hypothetical protein GCM10007094_23560 [Pseudovibrio japonicus]
MNEQSEHALKYSWAQTWADKPDDYIANIPHPPKSFLRIHKDYGPEGETRWHWVANTTINIGKGYADTQLEAQQSAEECFCDYVDKEVN